MANRSQMRLQQLTGSLAAIQSDADASYSTKALAANVQAADLHDILASMAGAIKRIHGQEFSNQDAGKFSHTIDVTGEVKASSHISGSADLSIDFHGAFGGNLGAGGDIVAGSQFIGQLENNLSASNGISIDQIFDNSGNSVVSIDSAWLGEQFSVVDTWSIDMTYDNAGEFQADLRVGSTDALIVDADGLDLKGTIAGARTFSDAITMSSTLEVTGDADLNGALDVAGAANFQGAVTVQGNLTVNGTTTTVNTEEVTIADHNIVIDSNNLSGEDVVNGAGFTFKGGSSDDLTFQWNTVDSDMELKKGSLFAKLHIGDLDAADISAADISAANITLSADISAVDGTFSGNVSAGGTLSVTGASTLSGAVSAGSTLSVTGASTLSGAVSAGSSLDVTGAATLSSTLDVSGAVTLSDLAAERLVATDAADKLVSIDLDDWIAGTAKQVIVTADAANAGKIVLSAPQDIDKQASVMFADITLSNDGTAGGQYGGLFADGSSLNIASAGALVLEDGYKSWASGDLKLATNADSWSNYEAAFGTKSLMDAIVAASVGDQWASKWEYAHSGAGSSSVASASWTKLGGDIASFAALMAMPADEKKARIEVYVNGQLMSQNSAGSNDRDYAFNTAGGSEALEFEFAIENDDIVQMIVR